MSVLLVECLDRRDLMLAISRVLFDHGFNVVQSQEFVDRESGRFFRRTEFDGAVDSACLVEQNKGVLPEGVAVRVASPLPKRIMVLVSREHHCLADLLIRNQFGTWKARIEAVVGNHLDLGESVGQFGVPFSSGSATGREPVAHEASLQACLEEAAPDFIVLANYLRILSPEFVSRDPARIINIHPSFLPTFVGARPSQQAFQHGVKVTGATAHFVTDALDQGPILVQQVLPVDPTRSAEAPARSGRDVEQFALAQARQLVLKIESFFAEIGRSFLTDHPLISR